MISISQGFLFFDGLVQEVETCITFSLDRTTYLPSSVFFVAKTHSLPTKIQADPHNFCPNVPRKFGSSLKDR